MNGRVTNTDTVSTDIVAILMHRLAVLFGSVFESGLKGIQDTIRYNFSVFSGYMTSIDFVLEYAAPTDHNKAAQLYATKFKYESCVGTIRRSNYRYNSTTHCRISGLGTVSCGSTSTISPHRQNEMDSKERNC